MLTVLLTWIYILVLSWVYGRMLLQLVSKVGRTEFESKLHFSLVIFAGFMALSCLSSLYGLFAPLNGITHLFLWTAGLTYVGVFYEKIRKEISSQIRLVWDAHWTIKLLFLAVLGVALLASISPSYYYDDGLYYRPTIKWFNEYAIIPGLGNIHPRLAFNSSWHVVAALFSFSFIKADTFSDLNGLVHLVIGIYSLGGLSKVLRGSSNLSHILRALMIFPTHVFVKFLMAPSADVPVIYGSWLMIILLFEKFESKAKSDFDIRTILIVMLGAWVVTVKLTAGPILLIPLYLFLFEVRRKNIDRMGLLVGMGLLLLMPWMGRSIMLSGYPVFPIQQIDLLDVDWKIPEKLVSEERDYIRAFAINPRHLYTELKDMSIGQWLPEWWAHQRFFHKALLGLNVLFVFAHLLHVFYGALSRRKVEFLKKHKPYMVCLASIFAGLILWFISAPDPRFAYTSLVGLYILSIAMAFQFVLLRFRFPIKISYLLLGLIGLFYLRPLQIETSHFLSTASSSNQFFVIWPGHPPQFPEEKFTNTNGVQFYKSMENDQCWDLPIPCTPFYNMNVQLRNPALGIQAGFRLPQVDINYYRNAQQIYQRPDGVEADQKAVHNE